MIALIWVLAVTGALSWVILLALILLVLVDQRRYR